MRHARCAEHIPIGAFNRVLVTHHQRGDHARELPVFDTLEDRLTHDLPGLLDRVAPAGGKPDRRCVMHAGTHIAGRLHALPHSQSS